MPALSYTSSNFPFQPYTKIYSADVNTCFTDIQTLLNTTKLDATNLQNSAVTYAKIDQTTVGSYLLPAGAVIDYGGSSAPSGFLACDGSAVSRSTYATLFAAIGTTWGTGDGSTTFNVPDLRGRASIGDGTGSGLSARTLGQSVGAESVNSAHTHTTPNHNHRVTTTDDGVNMGVYNSGGTVGIAGSSAVTGGGGGYTLLAANGAQTTVGGMYSSNAAPTTDSGGSASLSIMQPAAVVKKIIKT